MNTKDWTIRFAAEFGNSPMGFNEVFKKYHLYEDIKSFIQQELDNRTREVIEEIPNGDEDPDIMPDGVRVILDLRPLKQQLKDKYELL